ncbi:MAG: TonB-dependent receptor [Firmicutes bacterium]|nr:TonB-dependent receptor [Bacillota bacterium]
MFLGKKNLVLISTAILFAFGLAWGEESVYMGDLGVIVITPTRGPRMVKDLPTNVSVITREEIAESDAHNVGEVLNNRLGVGIKRYGTLGAKSQIALRGCSAFQTLVMVDGRPVNSISDGLADLSQFPIDNIERIEIVRGPASALYGANALGGVVNIITREAKEEKITADVNLGMGSFGTQIARLNFATMGTNVKAYFTMSNNISDGWRKNSAYDNRNFTGRLAYNAGKIGNFEFKGGYHRWKLGLPGEAKYEIDPSTLKEILVDERFASNPNHNQDNEKEYAILEYSNIGENSKLLLRAYGSNDQKRDRNPDGPRDDLYENITQGTEVQLDTQYGITLGMDIHQDKYKQRNEINSQTIIGEKTLNESIYLQETLSFKPMIATLGIRFDHHSAYGSQTNPSFSLVCQPQESLKLSFNLARGVRAPTFDDLYQPYALYDPGESWSYEAQGNPDLKPEKAWAYDLGFEHQLGNLLLSRVTLFRTNIEDLIDWTSVPSEKSSGLWFVSNVAKAYTQGIEVEFIHQIMPGLSQNINYTYLHSAGKKEGEEKYEIAPYKPHNRVNYRINYANNFGLKITLGTEYVDEQWEYRGKTGNRLPDYFLLNTRIAQRIRNLEAYISLDNILDKKYQTVFGYPMPGRTIMAGISWKFGS